MHETKGTHSSCAIVKQLINFSLEERTSGLANNKLLGFLLQSRGAVGSQVMASTLLPSPPGGLKKSPQPLTLRLFRTQFYERPLGELGVVLGGRNFVVRCSLYLLINEKLPSPSTHTHTHTHPLCCETFYFFQALDGWYK